jgi:hypothetical protein
MQSRVFNRGGSPSLLISLPLSLKGEGDKGGEDDDNEYRYTVYNWQ